MTDKPRNKTQSKRRKVVKRTEEPPKTALVQVQLGDGNKNVQIQEKKETD